MGNFPDTEFWQKILRRKHHKSSPELTGKCWDKGADSYDDLLKEPDYKAQLDAILCRLRSNGILKKEYTILDIACGTGIYPIMLSPYFKHIWAIDISKKMLKIFEKKLADYDIKNCSLISSDWRQYDFKRTFDIVFSSMNPLLGDYRNIDKMLTISRHFLILIGWAGIRKNELLERVSKKILGHALNAPKSDITTVFAYLYSLGYSPSIEYFNATWHRQYPIEKQLERIIWRLEFERKLTEDEKDFIKDELRAYSDENNIVKLTTKIRIGLIILDLNIT